MTSPKVLIVGAGLAGLSAACELSWNGIPVTILEARDRVGGRVWTLQDWEFNQFAEAGGEFVDSNHFHLQRYAQALGLSLITKRKKWFRFPEADVPVLDAQEEWMMFWESLRALTKQIPCPSQPWRISPALKKLDFIGMDEWAERLNASPNLRHSTKLYCRNMEAAEPEQTSTLGAIAEERLYENGLSVLEESAKIEGGSQNLAFALAEEAKAHGAEIILNAKVVSISRIRRQVTATAERKGEQIQYSADFMILTIPNTVVSDIHFEPSLSYRKRRAIQNTAYGHVVKNLIQFKRRFWLETPAQIPFHSDSVAALWDITDTQPGEAGILCAWVGGQPAIEWSLWEESERIERCLQLLERLYPFCRDHFVKARSICWQHDPFAKAAYSYYGLGSVTEAAPYLRSPVGRIHFAGEHTSPFIGYMEGALESGNRAAQEILTRVNRNRASPSESDP